MNIPWYDSLDTPGAFQMGFVRPFHELVPDQGIIMDGTTYGGAVKSSTINAAFQTHSRPPTSGRGNDWILILEGE